MNIVVCIKHVPEVIDAELKINKDGAGVVTDDLEFDINEWDGFAVESAIRLKEAHGGKVTAITLGDEESEEALRNALAMGADEAIRFDSQGFEQSDAQGIARGLHAALEPLTPDLLLTGAQSSDNGWGQVGLCLAEMMGLPYASLVVDFELKDNLILAHRELEANTLERVELTLPCALTIQTGTNKPRYVSIMGIKKVRRIGIETLSATDFDLEGMIGAEASFMAERILSPPETGGHAEMIQGNLEEICERTAQVIREKGGLA